MFFSLSKQNNKRFPNHYNIGDLVLNTDNGWQITKDSHYICIFKGYCDDYRLSDIVNDISDNSQYYGNFCIFKFDKKTKSISLITDYLRSFAIWYSANNEITNLTKHSKSIWADTNIKINQQLEITESKKDLIGKLSTEDISLDDAIEFVYSRLSQKIEKFVSHNTLPLRVFLSGGIDSMLVYSFIKKFTKNYELVLENRNQWDYFWCNNHGEITQDFWGYTQINHYLNPCVLTSGAPGDEFMFRNPTMIDRWLSWNGLNMQEFLQESYNKKKYRYDQFVYFNAKSKNLTKEYQLEKKYLSKLDKQKFFKFLCNNVVNDLQHWHLGNTLTYTPLRDIEIFKTLIRLSPDDARGQIAGGEISLRLIEMNDPTLINYLSLEKNTKSYFHNLPLLMDKISTSSGQ